MRLAAVMFFAAAALAGCGYYGNDEGVRYLQRKDTVTLSAGDASQANAVAQTIHPWPRYVGNRNIPMEGTRGVRAMECYRQGPGKAAVGQASEQININTGAGTSTASSQETQLICDNKR